MAADSYNDGDRVFVKMKGYPPWPAMVKDRIPGKVEAYNVFFYGSYDSAKAKPDCMSPYNEETKIKFGKPQRKGGAKFKQAMDEIENNFEISAPEPQSEPVPEAEPVDEDVGELVIDEAIVPPPVLKKEGKVTPASGAKKVPAKKEKEPKLPPLSLEEAPAVEEPIATPPPTKQPRRGSKAGKKDLGLVIPSTPEPSTPAAEVVSRSGRKIKPKRFADEEVQFSTPPGAKPSPTTEEGKSLEATPVKRTKRTSSIGSKTPVTPTPEVKPEVKALPPPPPLERPKPVAPKRNPKRKVSTDVTAEAAVAVPSPPPLTRPPPPLRPMPTLIPAPSSPSVLPAPNELEEPKPEPAVEKSDEPNEKSKVEVPGKMEEAEKHGKEGEEFSALSSNRDSSNPPSPGDHDSKDAHDTDDDDGTEKENNLQEEPSDNYENGIWEDSDEALRSVPKRMRVDLKNGTASAILGFNHDRPTYFRNEAASIEYDMATARSVLQTKTELEVNETAFLKTIADSLPPSNDEKEAEARVKTELIQKKVAQLRMEGEIVETIGELVGSLGAKFAFCDRALDLLDKLGSRNDINILALKKNPEVVNVIRRVQNYHGNVSEWPNLNQVQIEDFHVKAEMIREKAIGIYQSFKLLFCATAEKPFYDSFTDELGKFNDAVAGAGISESDVIRLFDDPVTRLSEKPPTPTAVEESADSTPSTIVGDTNGVAEEDESEVCS